MTAKWLLAIGVAVALGGCSSGDIEIAPATSTTNSNNTTNTGGNGGNANDVCASYVNTAGQTIRGTYDGTNCTYSPSFVDAGNNLRFDMTIPALPNSGAHIFQGSLFVGESHSTNAELQAAGIAEGGDGPVLTVEAGATVAFTSERQFLVINRGSQIFAVGTPNAPITFTSVSDVDGSVGPEDVQQWGGIVIDGFGVTNACAYNGTYDENPGVDTLTLAGECHVDSEGSAGLDENQYGGDNNDDSSGRLEYVIVKHTGATVGNGDELNGITFGAVGRNTIVNNVQAYSTYDDGLEFFGGAVNVSNYVALYVRDDSIDIDEGWSGTMTNALVIQSATDGNHCIEADGLASYGTQAADDARTAQNIQSHFTINNLTCILSGHGQGTHAPSAGWHLREGLFADINNALVVASFNANSTTSATDNYCLRIDNSHTQAAATNGNLNFNSVIYACGERTNGAGFDEEAFATGTTPPAGEGNVFATVPSGTAVNPTAAADPGLQLLEGTPAIYSIAWASSQVNGAAPAATTTPVAGAAFLGALSLSQTDWTQPWAYGIHSANRAQPLWFE